MSSGISHFEKLESDSANNFVQLINQTSAKQIIYLSGITNENKLSRHLSSRKNVEEILKQSYVPLTVLKAGIIVGSGSASFEIIREIAENTEIIAGNIYGNGTLGLFTTAKHLIFWDLLMKNEMKNLEMFSQDHENTRGNRHGLTDGGT